MDKDTEFTPMVFRTFKKGGDVLALMPSLPGTNDPDTCMSYQHVGQHGSADYTGCMRITRPATQEEFMPLVQELESLGYRVLRVARATRWHFNMRVNEIRKVGA